MHEFAHYKGLEAIRGDCYSIQFKVCNITCLKVEILVRQSFISTVCYFCCQNGFNSISWF